MIPHSDNLQIALRTSCEVAEEKGLSFEKAIILSDRSNFVIHLYPTSVVARVAANTTKVRKGDGWLSREVAVATHLSMKNAPIIPPSLEISPGPHQHNGLVLSFWEFVEELKQPLDPFIAGQKLRECHQALADFNGQLPLLDGFRESQNLILQLISEGRFCDADIELLHQISVCLEEKLAQIQLPMQAIHGDAHLLNVLNTTRGVLWTDWEDTFMGYTAWDIACMISSSRIFGTDIDEATAALNGYGGNLDDNLLEFFVELRTFQTIPWNIILSKDDSQSLERLQQRLQWFRQRI
jgi:thiamine kinase-like enzyme